MKTISKSKEEFKTKSDEFGNKILCKNNGKRIILTLSLVSENRKRRLGIIIESTRTLNIMRKRQFHLHYMSNSYGFNYEMLLKAKRFDKVRIEDEKEMWLVDRNFILENGKFLFFKEQGFEKQIFLTLEQLQQFKRNPIL